MYENTDKKAGMIGGFSAVGHRPRCSAAGDAMMGGYPDVRVAQNGGLPHPPVEEPEGLGDKDESFGDYSVDAIRIRQENWTVHDIMRRIEQGNYVMNPDFQRDFVWSKDKQSRLIESVAMRIPLPVFYVAENSLGRMVVVDGLQRLSTFHQFVNDKLRLQLSEKSELNGKLFSDLLPKFQNRIVDCDLIFYTIDTDVDESVRMDIFERVNSGEPLSRQQMRNCLFTGKATEFLAEQSRTDIFRKATGGGLNYKTMRDREFVNRFCAFEIIGFGNYSGDMDDFLACCLKKMNSLPEPDILQLSEEFHRGLANNFMLFDEHAFRKKPVATGRKSVLNASLWDVMSTGLSRYSEEQVKACADDLRKAIHALLDNDDFNSAITSGTGSTKQVQCRFEMAAQTIEEILGACKN